MEITRRQFALGIAAASCLPWSMIQNATASDAAVWVFMNIGTAGRARSTRAISEKRTELDFTLFS